MNLNIRNPKYCSAAKIKIDVTLDHPDFGEIPYTFDPTTEDQSYDSEIRAYIDNLEEGSITEYVPYIPTQEQLDQVELRDCYAYLTSTDWVIAKLSEAQAIGEDTTSLLEKYETIINERSAKRTRINELEIALTGE